MAAEGYTCQLNSCNMGERSMEKDIIYHRHWIFKKMVFLKESFPFPLGNLKVFGMDNVIFILFIVYIFKASLLRKSNTY